MRRGIRRLILNSCLGLISTTVICSAFLLWPCERRLLRLADRVTNISGWDWSGHGYEWVSDEIALIYTDPGFNNNENTSLVAHHVRSGAEMPWTGMAQRLDERQAKYNIHKLSPDGNWMLYSDYYRGTVSVTSQDGRRCVRWRDALWNYEREHTRIANIRGYGYYLGWQGIQWLPNSREWVQPEFDPLGREATRIVVRCIDDPKRVRSIAIPRPSRFLFGEDRPEPVWLSDTHIVQQTWQPDYLQPPYVRSGSPEHSVDFYEGDLRTKSPPRKWTVYLPANWEIRSVALSNRADYVAWVVHTHQHPGLLAFLRRIGFPIKPEPQAVTALYVSRIDGSAMRELGHVPTPVDGDQDIFEVSWLPGERRLSFVYKYVLYTIAAF